VGQRRWKIQKVEVWGKDGILKVEKIKVWEGEMQERQQMRSSRLKDIKQKKLLDENATNEW